MTVPPSDSLAALHDWQDAMREAEAQLDALLALTMAAPEGPLPAAIHAVMGMATRLAARLSGVPADVLEAWWLEHDFGARPMRAGLIGQPMQELATIDEVWQLLAEGDDGQ